MIVGALGDIVFQVSYETVETAKRLLWSGSARYSVHNRHNWHALEEYTGIDPDEMSFDIYLSNSLGTDAMKELVKIWTYERQGTPVSLVFGDHAYGKFRWVIRSHSTDMETFDREGNLTTCTVKLDLLEYMKD